MLESFLSFYQSTYIIVIFQRLLEYGSYTAAKYFGFDIKGQAHKIVNLLWSTSVKLKEMALNSLRSFFGGCCSITVDYATASLIEKQY
jgi:hypothetical protein